MTTQTLQRPTRWSPGLALSCTGLQHQHGCLGDAVQAARAGHDLVTAATPPSMDAATLFDAERACLEMAAELSAITGGSYDAVDAAQALLNIAELAGTLSRAATLQARSEVMVQMRALATQGRA